MSLASLSRAFAWPPSTPADGLAAGARGAALSFLAVVLAALALWAPTLLIDFGRGDSLDDNLIWSTQFSRLVAAGHLYPRWLPGSFEGLGSPAFNFYPPLPFWTTALVSELSGAWASPMLQLKLAALAALVASGVSMRLWLGRFCPPAKALVCALVYMAAPYHLMDHYVRGAFAEFFAIAVIPLVPLGLLQTRRGERWGPVTLAASYALLIFSHLPIALLASVLLVAPYGLALLWSARGERLRFALAAATGLGCGAGLGALYLAPALMLQGSISPEYLWSIAPAQHLFTSAQAWANPFEPVLAALAAVEAALALAIGWRAWRGKDRRPAFWVGLTVAVFLALSGLVPGLWSIPLMSKVQFPWRAMAIEEFALVTLMALSAWPTARGAAAVFAVLALANPGLSADLKNIALGRPQAELLAPGYVAALLRAPVDAPEYLPQGMLVIRGRTPAPRIPLDALAAAPLASGSRAASSDPLTGAVRLQPLGGPVVLRRFYFPSWRVDCDGVPVAASAVGAARLVGFVAPAGARRCEAAPAASLPERLGDGVAAASLAALAGYAAWMLALAARRRRPSPALPRTA